MKEDTRQQTCQGQRQASTQENPDRNRRHTLLDDESVHVTALRPEGHTDADLSGPLARRVRDHAVDADNGKPQRQHREDPEHRHENARPYGIFVQDLLHGPYLIDWLVWIDTPHALLHRAGERHRIAVRTDQ